jgi:serine/threonine protein kinase
MAWEAKAGAKLGDRYALEAKVGEGGMGEVWRARHLALESEVAIKFLSKAVASNAETRKRFLMEAKLTAQIRTRHAVQVFDFGVTEDGHPYLVMELLRGEPLSRRIERLGKLDLVSTVRIMSAAAKALARAHHLGIIHRDFKPDNIFLTQNDEKEDEVKVVDFGIAKLLGSLDETESSASAFAEAAKSVSSLTSTGRIVGTPNYMSPEQIGMSAELGPAVDVWAFGIVAFECLTGKSPFEGDDVISLFSEIANGRFRKARDFNPLVPRAFDAWMRKACAADPRARFPDAPAASSALAATLTPGLVREPTSASSLVVTDGGSEAHLRIGNAATLLNSSTEALVRPSRGTPWRALSAGAAAVIVVGALMTIKPAWLRSALTSAPPAVEPAPVAPPSIVRPAEIASPALTTAPPHADPLPRLIVVDAVDAGTPHAAHMTRHRERTKPSVPPTAAAPPPAPSARPEPPPPSGPPSPFALPPLGL